MVEDVLRGIVTLVFIAAMALVIFMIVYVVRNPVEHDQESEDALRQVADEAKSDPERAPKSPFHNRGTGLALAGV